jgi:membrane dipeptidase
MRQPLTMSDKPIPVFDGHNDVLLRLYRSGRNCADFFERGDVGHMDLPRCREGGLAGGFFAVFVPAPAPDTDVAGDPTNIPQFPEGVLPPPLEPDYAQRTAIAVTALLFRLEAQSEGQLKVVRTADEISDCLQRGVMAAILHFEGAEPIDTDLNALHVFYRAGLRSLGIVWSRPNAFGEGVPFKFAHSPDTGPGLTDAGRELVRECNRLGIMIDLSHINERGFWDVAALSTAPLVATHSNAHALCPSTRNLTDRQLDAIRESGGMVGVNFGVGFLRDDGAKDPATPLEAIVRHVDYLVERLGIDHVGFGSDFDGVTIPSQLGDVCGLPKLLSTLQAHGYDEPSLRKLCFENWLGVLGRTLRPGSP